jgi:hypothetical protein
MIVDGKEVKEYNSNMYYCVHRPSKTLVSRDSFGGISYSNNPNDMKFLIKGAWEDALKYRADKADFEIIEFVI